MSLVNTKYVVLIDNGSTTEEVKELCYLRTIRKSGKSFYEFSHKCRDGHIFKSKSGAIKCRNRLRENGYHSWVETIYIV